MEQREAAIALFEKGIADMATASSLGVHRKPVGRLYERWKIRGRGALVAKPKQVYSFEVKLALVERFIAGETSLNLATEAGLSSPLVLQKWVREYRRDGADGLRPKPKGRPRSPKSSPPAEVSELERLRRENELLRAEVAYLGKLRALSAQEPRR
ncbi:hypothetical protein MN0502_09550 [Arthrobacter sp. MN05-02]|nr:hypothetical protein MN0502_07920 [Arthrobacter sp. MN05-02]BBE22072.1 hypothetical protein MN0502_09550 [Arthrobacter sp. MN05-02]